ncbi:MAG: cyclic nucleotide-binding domain-containing protein [Thermodesulfobacteriota bacterium]
MNDAIYKGPLFSKIPRADADLILKASTKQKCKPGEIIFSEEDIGDCLWIVEVGAIEAYTMVGPNTDRVIETFRDGETFGDISFVDESLRSAGARAIEESTLRCLTREAFNALAAENINVAKLFFERLAYIMAERLRLTTSSYKESVSVLLKAIGASSLNLHLLAETFSEITATLTDGSAVTGQIIGFDNQPSGWALLIKNKEGAISLIPYHAVIKIEVK